MRGNEISFIKDLVLKQGMAKKVMCFGTFDVIHPGHLNYFEQAKKFGDYLVVVVARDKNVESIKGKKPMFSEQERLKQVNELEVVDKAVLGNNDDFMKVVVDEKPDIVCLGYDQSFKEETVKKQLKERGFIVEIKRLKPYYPEKFKSTLIKDKMILS